MSRSAALVLVSLVALGACDSSPWRWSEPESSPDHPLQVERAGWRTVGQRGGDDLWAWVVEFRNRADTGWTGRVAAGAEITGGEGIVLLGSGSREDTVSLPPGATTRIKGEPDELPLPLVDDAVARYAAGARTGCRLEPETDDEHICSETDTLIAP